MCIVNKNYLVPQAVIDIVESMQNSTNKNLTDNYRLRIEATLQYCQDALNKFNVKIKR
jgi:hypothetical protein